MRITYRNDQAREVRFLPAARRRRQPHDRRRRRIGRRDLPRTPLTRRITAGTTPGSARPRSRNSTSWAKRLNWNASTDLDWTVRVRATSSRTTKRSTRSSVTRRTKR